MLHLRAISGEEVAAGRTEEFPSVFYLKQHLQGLCGVPRFQQWLVLEGSILDDDAALDFGELQLVLQPFIDASKRQAGDLIGAARRGSPQQVEEILQRPQNPDLTNRYGMTPLYIAARDGQEAIVRLLVEARANLEKRKRYPKRIRDMQPCAQSALGAAALSGHEQVTCLLLEARADPNKSSGKYHGSDVLGAGAQDAFVAYSQGRLSEHGMSLAAVFSRS